MAVFFVSSALAGFGVDGLPWWLAWMAPAPVPPAVELPPSCVEPERQERRTTTPAQRRVSSWTELEIQTEHADDRRVVQSTIRRKLGQIKYCYEEALREDPTLEGRVEMYWRLDGGRPRDVRTDSELNPALIACITRKVERWVFPVEVGDGDVSWPFEFRPRR